MKAHESEAWASMDASNGSRGKIDLATAPERAIEDALAHWDELPAAGLEDLARHAVHGPRLRRLQLAEAWLHEQAAGEAPEAVAACPTSEELYDYGRGPGSTALAGERRAEIDRHTLRCGACRGLVATLERRPPVPLDLLPLPPADAEPELAPASRARLRLVRTLLPLAAAAAVLLFALPRLDRSEASVELPTAPILRDGGGGEALLLPRGPVLCIPGTTLERRIELAAVPGATAYRVQLLRHGGGAFETGEPVGELLATDTNLVLPHLEPGHYTWSAWAEVDGLWAHLGRRDFEVVESEDIVRSLARATTEADARRLIVEFDARGLVTDARALARLLPPSPERDAYLAAPGR